MNMLQNLIPPSIQRLRRIRSPFNRVAAFEQLEIRAMLSGDSAFSEVIGGAFGQSDNFAISHAVDQTHFESQSGTVSNASFIDQGNPGQSPFTT